MSFLKEITLNPKKNGKIKKIILDKLYYYTDIICYTDIFLPA